MKVEGALMTADFTKTGELAADLERQGFDCAISFEGPHDPFFPLLLAAQQTERLELATGIAIAFARNPMICAQIANDLHTLTQGRFILGLGSQIKPHIEKRFSMPWSKPAARMREFVQAIRAIWANWHDGEPLQFRGEFYTHTLSTPVFNPGPNAFGKPKIFVAGVGPRMVEVAGEVGDGFFVHPLHSPSFLDAVTLPAIDKGLATSGRQREDFEISCQTICMVGSNDEEIDKARTKAKGQISFYGSTPAYAGVLEHHGWDVHPELNRLSKQGKWFEMMALVSDEMLDTIGVSGTPAEVGAKLRERNGAFADRTLLTLYNETESDAVIDLIRALRQD
jgi:probable F420-dependent oxidoreductase